MASLCMVCSMGSPFCREMEAARDELRAVLTMAQHKSGMSFLPCSQWIQGA